MKKRIILPSEEMNFQPVADGFLQVGTVQMQGAQFPSTVFGRANGSPLAMKAVLIIISDEMANGLKVGEIQTNIIGIREHLADAYLVLLHHYRPITYIEWLDDGTETGLQYNVQVELPGGIMEAGELAGTTAKREALEESGLYNHQIIASFPLYFGYIANSAGHQIERYGTQVVLATGYINTEMMTKDQQAEGIAKAELVPIRALREHVDTLARNGYMLEWAVRLAVAELSPR